MAHNLRTLSEIIAGSVQEIDEACNSRGSLFPSLDEPITPEKEEIRHDPAVLRATPILVAAAYQIIALARPPATSMAVSGCSYYLAACLRVATELNVTEIIRSYDSGNGYHVKDIAGKIGTIDPQKLSRVLRFLATHHIYRETSPDVYANNALSSVVDSGKALETVQKGPENKHEGTTGLAALIGHTADEDCKGASYLLETLTDPRTASSAELVDAPMMRAFGSSIPIWPWLELPENSYRFSRFGMAMAGVNSIQPANAILSGFDWDSLSDGSVVVDVGGGIGTTSIALARSCPKLCLIVQDRNQVVQEGVKHAMKEVPEALHSGKLSYEVHDFFEPQSIQSPAVFILKQITHDWADRYAKAILVNLRRAAGPNTRLVVIENIVPYASAECGMARDIPGAKITAPVPEPLLPNLGAYDPMPYVTDLSMLVHFNGQERTVAHLDSLLNSAGWEIVRIVRPEAGVAYLPQIIAIPTHISEDKDERI